MNRREERLVWTLALDVFEPPELQGLLLDSIKAVYQARPEWDVPRFASADGMAEVAAQVLDDIHAGKQPLRQEFRSFNREHLQALKAVRFDLASEALRRVPNPRLTPRLAEIKFSGDLGE